MSRPEGDSNPQSIHDFMSAGIHVTAKALLVYTNCVISGLVLVFCVGHFRSA